MVYETFDLSIERSHNPQSYKVRVLQSPSGEAAERVTMLVEPHVVGDERAYGRSLFDSVFRGQVLDVLRKSEALALQRQSGLLVRIRSEEHEVRNWRWELLYDPEHGDFMALSSRTPVVRYREVPSPAAIGAAPPLRVLGMAAGSGSVAPLDATAERR